jgi:hypothetical protein
MKMVLVTRNAARLNSGGMRVPKWGTNPDVCQLRTQSEDIQAQAADPLKLSVRNECRESVVS